jgi:hypothetical protein
MSGLVRRLQQTNVSVRISVQTRIDTRIQSQYPAGHQYRVQLSCTGPIVEPRVAAPLPAPATSQFM